MTVPYRNLMATPTSTHTPGTSTVPQPRGLTESRSRPGIRLPAWVVVLAVMLPVSVSLAGLPANHPVYDFLHRAWLYGATGQPPTSIRPDTMPELLNRLADVHAQRDRLPAAERVELDELLADLAVYGDADTLLPDETRWSRRTGFGDRLFSRGAHLYALRRGDLGFSFDPIVGYDGILDQTYNGEALFRSVAGFEVRAALGEHWSAGVRFTDTGEYNQNEAGDLYTQGSGYEAVAAIDNASSFDETMAWLEYHSEYVDVGIGRDRMARGPSLEDGLLLSGRAPSYNYVQLRARMKPWLSFDVFHARLDPAPEPDDTLYRSPSGTWRRVENQKWLASHRLEWTPAGWVALGLSETVIYAERDAELGYMIPLNFFWSENHHQDRDDNIAWGLDLRLQPVGGVELLAEWLLDETSVSGVFSSKLLNRTGYLLGIAMADPLGLHSSLLEVNFSRLRPFVYSHWYSVSIYTHSGVSLGSTQPPNSERFLARLSKRVGGEWVARLEVEHLRHGRTPEGEDPVGGELGELVPVGKRNETYPLLDGDRSSALRMEAGVTWEPLERLAISGRAGATRTGGTTFSLFLLSFAYNL